MKSRHFASFFGLLVSMTFSNADLLGVESDRSPSKVEVAIQSGLTFLAQDALAWKAEHDCVSCHHAGLIAWSMQEARSQGHTVDEQVLGDLTRWMAESGDGKTSLARPEGVPQAVNFEAIYLALALGVVPNPDDEIKAGLSKMLATVREDQTEAGSWSSWPETRPPMFGGSDESTTVLALLSLLPTRSGDDPASALAIQNGLNWLDQAKLNPDLQTMALRLVLLMRVERNRAECESLVQQIKNLQNADGGWSQTADMASDAWATGQTLYALAHMGLNSNDQSIQRAQDFLVNSQLANGSWPMTSRPSTPDGEGADYLVPIVGGGTAWAVMALARSQ